MAFTVRGINWNRVRSKCHGSGVERQAVRVVACCSPMLGIGGLGGKGVESFLAPFGLCVSGSNHGVLSIEQGGRA
jgi:hypothetical protein